MRGYRIKRIAFYAATPLACILLIFSIAEIIWPIRFKLDFIAHGRVTDGGGRLVIDGFTSSQGNKLWFARSSYPLPEKASQVFGDTLSRAVCLIERTPKFDRQGLRVGERAVARLVNPENGEQYVSVFWTNGRILSSIDSSSMTDALQFEQYRNND